MKRAAIPTNRRKTVKPDVDDYDSSYISVSSFISTFFTTFKEGNSICRGWYIMVYGW